MEEIAATEHSFVKVPYEQLCKSIRCGQALLEAEIQSISSSLKEVSRTQGTPDELASRFDGLTTQLIKLREKLQILNDAENAAVEVSDKRIKHLKEGIRSSPNNDAEHEEWKRQRLDRIICDHLLRVGHYDTAEQLAKFAGIEDFTNLNIFGTSRIVESALKNHDCTLALKWCEENSARLTKLKSTLEFKLRLQEYVELVRQGKRGDAIAYAGKHFKKQAHRHLQDIQVAMSLLVFARQPLHDKHKEYFDENRWETLVQQFRRNNFALHSLSGQSVLEVTLQAGLSSLKNSACLEPDEKNADCPVCSTNMNALAQPLPFAHHTNSRLVCHMSGAIMDEDNPPMMLPNGFVYSRDALVDMSKARGGVVTCPRSHKTYAFSDVVRVYIM
eukprot:m.1519052 g.1519052  ORF g.1519052 m.1519052 type:complete len:387 (+) comp25223_c0_seq3:165-1325(+)